MCKRDDYFNFQCRALQDDTCCGGGDEEREVRRTIYCIFIQIYLFFVLSFQTGTIPVLGDNPLGDGQFFKSDAGCPKPYRVCYDEDSHLNPVDIYGNSQDIYECPGTDNDGAECSGSYGVEVNLIVFVCFYCCFQSFFLSDLPRILD